MKAMTRLATGLCAVAALGLAWPAAAAPPVKIGCSMALTGGVAVNGKQVMIGFELWRDDINAKGGLLGRKVELDCYDDQSNPALVPGIYTKLIEIDKVDLTVGPYATNMAVPAIPVLMQHKMTTIAVTALAANSHFHYPGYFVMLPSGPQPKLAFSAGFFDVAMTMNPKPKTVALAAADAEFAKNSVDGARENAKAHGLKIVYDKAYPPTTTDYTPIIRAIQATHPDIVYDSGYNPDTIGMINAAHEVGLKAMMFGGNMIGLASTTGRMQMGPLANGIVYNDAFSPAFKFPGLQAVLAKYRVRAKAAGTDPLGYGYIPFAYGALQILGDAVTATGGFDQQKIAQYIHTHTFSTVAGDITFGPDGEWTKARVITEQFRGITSGAVEQFEDPKKVVVLAPAEYKTGDLVYPYSAK
ncbi:MAG TPA: amino acid ABC transporter substrate-binding protein [Stellaceae bacterium]|nr:amino acid ABC transporter substrate-binding protein [Stellaceae bacterium]